MCLTEYIAISRTQNTEVRKSLSILKVASSSAVFAADHISIALLVFTI
jgi:hypothetical protein